MQVWTGPGPVIGPANFHLIGPGIQLGLGLPDFKNAKAVDIMLIFRIQTFKRRFLTLQGAIMAIDGPITKWWGSPMRRKASRMSQNQLGSGGRAAGENFE
jgi:hypothetical protein